MTYFKNNVWIMEGSSGSVDIHDFNTVSSVLVMYNTMLNYLDITTTMWSSFSSQLFTGYSVLEMQSSSSLRNMAKYDLHSSKMWKKLNSSHLRWNRSSSLSSCENLRLHIIRKTRKEPHYKNITMKIYNKINLVIDLNDTGQTLSRL